MVPSPYKGKNKDDSIGRCTNCCWRAVVILDVKVNLLSLCMIFEIKSIINTNLVAKTGSILRVYEATFIKEKYE